MSNTKLSKDEQARVKADLRKHFTTYIVPTIAKIRALHAPITHVANDTAYIVGILECPICGKELHYRISCWNEHIHGQCEDENCLNWMM